MCAGSMHPTRIHADVPYLFAPVSLGRCSLLKRDRSGNVLLNSDYRHKHFSTQRHSCAWKLFPAYLDFLNVQDVGDGSAFEQPALSRYSTSLFVPDFDNRSSLFQSTSKEPSLATAKPWSEENLMMLDFFLLAQKRNCVPDTIT